MPVNVMLASMTTFAVLGFVVFGGPMLLVHWSRKRRQDEIARQIALTDAIDAEIGPIVAPVVKKSLLGPWDIRIAVPVGHSATVARILSVVDTVFMDLEGAGSRPYRIFLTARADASRGSRASRTLGSTTRWAGNPIGAA